jgi:hypothetical protein
MLTDKEYYFVKKVLDNPTEPKYKLYMEVYGCKEASARANSIKMMKKPEVKKFLDELRIQRNSHLKEATYWDKNKLMYKLTELAELAIEKGTEVYNTKTGALVGYKRDLGTARACYADLGKLIGAYEEDNQQKAPVNNFNLAEIFNQEKLE